MSKQLLADVYDAEDVYESLVRCEDDELEVVEKILAVIQKRADDWSNAADPALGDPDIDTFSRKLADARHAVVVLRSGAPRR